MADRDPALVAETSRRGAVYSRGEEVGFRIRATCGAGGLPTRLQYVLAWDGGEPAIERGSLGPRDLPFETSLTPDRPGFLHLGVDCPGAREPLQAGAAYAPEQIGPSLPIPEDFDNFWSEQLATLASSPMEAGAVPHSSNSLGSASKLRIGMPGGRDIHGWLLVPPGDGPHPGLVIFHGGGVYPVPPEVGLDWASRGVMVLSINPHPIPNDRPGRFYEDLARGGLADYRIRGRESRERLYFVEMFLRAARAVDYLASLDHWDGRHLVLAGHSQGGGQALAAAALNSKVSAIAVSCSTHCDHTGPVVGRVAGWPKLVEVRDGIPDPRHVLASRYIDGVNFASRINCPAFFSLGFLDDLCPPTGIYAAYNQLQGEKRIRHEVFSGHLHTDGCKEDTYEWVAAHNRG